MLVVFKNIKYDNVLVFDAEYNEGDLIQFSSIMFRKVEENIFQISKSINIYVKLPEGTRMNRFIQDFTGITDNFLAEHGVELDEAVKQIGQFIEHAGSMVFVSHGLYNDRLTLFSNGVDFYEKNAQTEAVLPGICTYNLAKKVLKRQNKLSLGDVATEAGLFISNHHNAFDDTLATVAVLSLLCKLQEE